MNARIACLGLLLLCGAIATGDAGSGESPDTRLAQSDAAKTTPPPAAEPIGTADSARWTATTYEAAASEANKAVLASGKPATVTGEIVDISCYLQLGKRGEAHIACGSKCIENGEPIGIVDAEEKLYILFAEEHHPRRDGKVSLKKVFAPQLAKTVTVNGMMTEMKDYRGLFVRVADIPAAKPKSKGTVKKP